MREIGTYRIGSATTRGHTEWRRPVTESFRRDPWSGPQGHERCRLTGRTRSHSEQRRHCFVPDPGTVVLLATQPPRRYLYALRQREPDGLMVLKVPICSRHDLSPRRTWIHPVPTNGSSTHPRPGSRPAIRSRIGSENLAGWRVVADDFTYQPLPTRPSRTSVAVDVVRHAADVGGGSVVETSEAGPDYEIGAAVSARTSSPSDPAARHPPRARLVTKPHTARMHGTERQRTVPPGPDRAITRKWHR